MSFGHYPVVLKNKRTFIKTSNHMIHIAIIISLNQLTVRFAFCKVSQKISRISFYLQSFSMQHIVFPVSFMQTPLSYIQSSTFFNLSSFLNFSIVVIKCAFNNFEFKFFKVGYTVVLFVNLVFVIVKSTHLI